MASVAYRHAAYDTPWWVNPSRRQGRFHRALRETTQYLCLHPLGPAAEFLRHHLGPDGVSAADTAQLNLWAAMIETDGVVPVAFDDCEDHGITPDELVGDDGYAPTQALADRLRAAGATGLRVPSAALPGTDNLVLFGPRVLHSYLATATSAEECPTGHLSDGARPAVEALPLVRWLGAPHFALEAWKRSGVYAPLEDPIPIRW